MKSTKKYYAISVKEENKHTGNHSISMRDWRWRDKYIMFNMKDGSKAKVDKKQLSAYLLQDPKSHSIWLPVETVDKETGEKVMKHKGIWLVPDSYIITHNLA